MQKCNWITEKWYTTYENNAVKLTFNIEPHIVHPEVVIDEQLQLKNIVFGWLLLNCHALNENHSQSVQAVTVSNLLCEIMNHELCPGLPLEPKALFFVWIVIYAVNVDRCSKKLKPKIQM